MSLFHFPKKQTINEWAADAKQNSDIVLLDVRTCAEFEQGHIPGSTNLELARADQIIALVPARDKPIYVYCRSGGRSAQACARFKQLGYSNVVNIGGILSWRGEIEKGGNCG